MIQKEAEISVVEAKLIKDMAAEEQQRSGLEDQDPLVKLKQQEIDLKAAELMQKTQQDETDTLMKTAVEAEKLDLEREKMQSTNELGVMKESFGMIKDQEKETVDEIKEDLITLREDARSRSNERIAAMKERGKANGKKQNNKDS